MHDNRKDIRQCAGCGREYPGEGIYCPWCGKSRHGANREENGQISWEIERSILSNPVIIKQLALGYGIAIFLLVLFLFFLGLIDGQLNMEYLVFLGKLFIYMFLGFSVLTVIGVLVVMGNRYGYIFTINSRGIMEAAHARQYRRNTVVNTILGGLSILSRNPSTLGVAVLSQARQKQFVRWKDINRVETNPWRKEIILKRNRRTMMIVFCHGGNYEEVYQAILSNIEARE